MKITKLITSIVTIITCLAISQPTAIAAGEEGAKEGAKRKVVIGFIAKSLANDVFQVAQAGAKGLCLNTITLTNRRDTGPYVRWCGRTAGVTPPPTR